MLFLLRVDEMGSPRRFDWVFKEGLIEQKQKNCSAIVWKFCGTDKKRLYEGVLHNSEHVVYECVNVGMKVVPVKRLTGWGCIWLIHI